MASPNEPIPPRRQRNSPDPNPTALLLLGPPNTGKSSLLSHLLPSNASSAPALHPTTEPHAYAAALPNGERVLLIDTPGFDPGAAGSTAKVVEVVSWICAFHARNPTRVRWGGVLYFASVTKAGVVTPGVVRVLEQLVGADDFSAVRVVTTEWTDEDPEGREAGVERDLREGFGTLIEGGAGMVRWDGGAGGALRIVRGVVNGCCDAGVVFRILREVVEERKMLVETGVGGLLSVALDERERVMGETLEGVEGEIERRGGLGSEDVLDFWVRWREDLEGEIGRVEEGKGLLGVGLRGMLRASGASWEEDEVGERRGRRYSFEWWRRAF
ncbi:hypothetical protein P171DRAFT_487976 [Karstenula rhodostoma CBS 690.94]|uniref:G domain-containing protein n=1 Tax=Karstenula rhodostoma CBS 690.94 TaxID=1392251 RepID=A0A9P4U922_9PLEO|nr:hypothetical protein P171DRAFT_487976 [Karstenula rhodostoma CBS 690.94]